MRIFTKENRPTREALETRIQELEKRQAAIPAEVEAARAELTRIMATGGDATEARAAVAESEAEAQGLPHAIAALRAELVETEVDRLEAAHAEKLERHRAAVDRLQKAHGALSKAAGDYDKAVDDPTLLGGSGMFGSVPRVKVPALDGYLSSAEHTARTDLQNQIDAARARAKREPTDTTAYWFDESRGKYRPLSERPPQAKPETSTVTLEKYPDHSGDGVKRKQSDKLPESLRDVKAPEFNRK